MQASEPFLHVAKSARGQVWQARPLDQRMAAVISQRLELPEIIGRVMAARGVSSDEAEAWLNPTIRGLMPKPSALMDLEKGAARLAEAIITQEKIGVLSDYDVDGVSSDALLLRLLRAVGSDLRVYIHERISQGYCPREKAVCAPKEQSA